MTTKLYIIKTVGDDMILGNVNGEVQRNSKQDILALTRNPLVEFVPVKMVRIGNNQADFKITVGTRKEQGGEVMPTDILLPIIHIVDCSCAAVWDPIAKTWHVDRNVRYGRDAHKKARKHMKMMQKSAPGN